MDHAVSGRIGLRRRAGVAAEGHGGVTRAVVAAMTRDDEAERIARRLAGELHRVLDGVGSAEREEHPSVLEAGFLEQALGQAGPRLGSPRRRREAEHRGLLLDGPDHGRVLVAEIHALGQAAHVDERPALLIPETGPLAAGDGGGVPVGLDAPAVQDGVPLGASRGHIPCRSP